MSRAVPTLIPPVKQFCQYVTFCLISNHLPGSQIICLSIHQLLWTFKPPVHRHKACLDPSCPLLWQLNNKDRELPAGYQQWRNTAQPERKDVSRAYLGRKLGCRNSAKSYSFSCACHKRKMLRIITTIVIVKNVNVYSTLGSRQLWLTFWLEKESYLSIC